MAGRWYVYRDGVEDKSHPLNGAIWGGTGAYTGYVGKYPVRDTVWVCPKRNEPSEPVRATDDGPPVMLKAWFPRTEFNEWFVFGTKAAIEKAGREFRPV